MWRLPTELIEALPVLVAAGVIDSLLRLVGLRSTARSRLAEAPEGELVVLTGMARRGPKVLSTPISSRPCIAYQLRIERYEQTGGQGGRYYPLMDDEGREDFFLEDETRRGRILGAKIEIASQHMSGWQTCTSSESLKSFMAQRGETYARKLRWRELLIREGDPIEVVGLVTRVKSDRSSQAPAPARDYRQPPAPELVIDAPDIGWIKVRILPR